MIIQESGMSFGEYSEENVFHIEKSHQYLNHLMPKGVKTCEFILLRDEILYFIEAKTSNPKEITAETKSEKIEKYNSYISDITEKMKHAVSLYASILLQRYDLDGVPDNLTEQNLSNKEIRLILVVKNAQQEWLISLQDKLRSEMRAFLSVWKINSLFVINETIARNKHFIM